MTEPATLEADDEMCAPGGTSYEWLRVPMLADLECAGCGQIGTCAEGCERA